MNKPTRNVPEMRFKGFTEDWEQRKLGEVANFSKGKGYAKKDLIDNDGVPIILYGRLYTAYETLIEHVDTYAVKSNDAIISKGNEVIVPASGESADEIARASAVSKPGIIIGSDLNIIKLEKEIIPTFLALLISNGTLKYAIKNLAQGNSVVHLYNSNLKTLKIKYPIIKEQVKITSFIMKLENAIVLHQRKLKALESLKKAYLQNMFPKKGESEPKLRFANFSEDWEQRKLNELMDFSNGINASNDSYGKGRKMISVMDILDQSPLEYRNIRNSVDVPEKIENNKRVEKGDLVFVRSSEIPEEVGWAKAYFDDKFALHSGFSIRGKKKKAFDATFLEHSLNSYGRKQIEQKAGGSTRFNVSQETLNSISVYTPDIFEQTNIGILFKQFDITMALHQQKLDQLKKLQKAYLQKIFI